MLVDPMRRGSFGGGRALIKSVALDVPLGILVAPMMMMTQTLAVIDILRGRPSGWAAQNRVSDGIALSDAARHYRWHLMLGGAMALAAALGLQAAIWMAPIFAGLIAAPLLVAWTSRASLGLASARHGLFLIPEERRPNPLIRDAQPSAEDRSEPAFAPEDGRWPAIGALLPRRLPS